MRGERRSIGWSGLKRGHRARPLEWLVERVIFLVSLSTIVVVFLIFLFVAREALPVALGKTDSSSSSKGIPTEQLGKMSKAEIMAYLELTPEEFARLDQESLKELMQVKL